MLSQLNLNSNASPNDLNSNKSNLNQWHLIAHFFKKMILTKTLYKNYNAKLLAIVKAFKTSCLYLKILNTKFLS